jgi:hypothetical protein
VKGVLFVVLFCAQAHAESRSYAIVVGNNEPPLGSTLKTLRYSDDDAARYAGFFSHFARSVTVLSSFDASTHRRYAELSTVVRPPSLVELRAALRGVATQLETDRAAGHATTFYFVYSGHGAPNAQGAMALSFLDGALDRSMLEAELLLPATHVHLIVDACHAEAVVLGRGMFDREIEGDLVEAPLLAKKRMPAHVGVLLASASAQESHEWSRIESGVFTHELLSGLVGPADINHDGRVEYSEAQAFMAAANRNLKDPRAVPTVIAEAPRAAPRAALVDFRSFTNMASLEARRGELGRFSVELANGERYLDANLREAAVVFLPVATKVFVRSGGLEASFLANARRTFSSLLFTDANVETRGSIDDAYREGLFAAVYDASYYRGYVDSTGAPSVAFVDSAMKEASDWRKPVAITLWTVSGASLAAAGVSLGVALAARTEFERTPYQRSAIAAANQAELARNLAIGTAIASVLSASAALALWPWPEAPSLVVAPSGSGFDAAATFRF